LASLPFHGRGGEKEGGVPSQFESLISELNVTGVEAKERRQGDCGSVDGWEN
jgi:hypothetical protein